MATGTLLELAPSLVWSHFDELRRIPRGSGNEARAAQYVLSVAERLGLESRRDATGNLVIAVPASAGREDAPAIALQGHLDMVNEKNEGTEHDFDRDPIDAFVDGDWVRARGTTLGSDNGIGVCMALALAEDPDATHGPLELLFTLDEETGMTGAHGLGGDFVRARRMINLDTEEENAIYIGCAGGIDVIVTRPVAKVDAPGDLAAREIAVGGLRGGHSGVDIHEQRGNANRILARVLRHVADAVPIRLADVRGGRLRNAIPREARAAVLVAPGDTATLQARAGEMRDAIAAELARIDPGVTVGVREAEGAARALDAEGTSEALDLLLALPDGVQRMSHDVEGLVETSTNLATVALDDERLEVVLLSRGSRTSALDALNRRIRAIATLAGAEAREEGEYPGWTPVPESELLRTAARVHREVLGVEPELKAIHAGLECGVIGEAFPGMEMISIGPRIEGAHSPDERVLVPTVESTYRYLVALLDALSR